MGFVGKVGGTLYVVLDEEQIERIRKHDPWDFPGGGLCIAFARKDELEQLATMPLDEMVKYLRRGYTLKGSDYERSL
jgi:hypothetical protein